jgi:hypothetical protein
MYLRLSICNRLESGFVAASYLELRKESNENWMGMYWERKEWM